MKPEPPYYAVIFSSRLSDDTDGYAEMAAKMEELASTQPGFLGIESARGPDGLGITVSYWASLDDIARWRSNAEHRVARARGNERWYARYDIRIARVERAYDGPRRSG
ncbi:MAG: antibiotic biosynthesis monooxygenase [Wenzhouxiangellaceae bacterium]